MDSFTPLKIYNGTPECVPQGQPLPINELNETPPKGECPISILHRCKMYDSWKFAKCIFQLVESPILLK